MATVAQPEILDLRHFSAATLRPLLAEESRVWSERLRWDYRSSANLLLDYLDSHVLPGFVAIERDRLCGYIFCVYEQAKAVIGDVYGAPTLCLDAHKVEARLIYHLLELLQASPGVDRIESQLLLHPHAEHAASFIEAGFEVYERLFMELDLATAVNGLPADTSPEDLPQGIDVRAWRESDFPAAGKLIAQAYQGHLDARINDQYQTTAGSMRFLHNIVRFPGCGLFDAENSRVMVQQGQAGQEEMAAMLLCSRVAEGTAHVTQICVAPAFRRRGLASNLMQHCCRLLLRNSFSTLTLTVTAANAPAVHLYKSMGYTTRHTFDAMVWTRPPRSR